MENTETKTVETFDDLNHIQKLKAFGAWKRERAQIEKERLFHEKEKNLGAITWISDTLQIAEYRYRTTGKESKTMYVAIVDGRVDNHLAETPEMAFLYGLGYKYDGLNSQFASFAARMLNNFEPLEK